MLTHYSYPMSNVLRSGSECVFYGEMYLHVEIFQPYTTIPLQKPPYFQKIHENVLIYSLYAAVFLPQKAAMHNNVPESVHAYFQEDWLSCWSKRLRFVYRIPFTHVGPW